MIITSLKKKGNNVEIQFDNSEKILLDYKVVAEAGLRKNDVVNEKKLNELFELNEKNKIKETALKLIFRRMHSRNELKNKLIKKNFDKNIVDIVLEELSSKNYLNDLEFCRMYVEERFSKKNIGINKIKLELVKKGIDRKIIDEIVNIIDDNSLFDKAYQLALKKIDTYQYKKLDKLKKKQKIFSFLLSRGFQQEIIYKVIDSLSLK